MSMLDQGKKRTYYTHVVPTENEAEKWFMIGGDWGEMGTEV